MDVWSDFLAGCCSGVAGTFGGHPIDTVKVRQQTFTDQLTIRQCIRLSLKNEGITGLFKGMSSPLYTAALVNTTFFGIYGNAVKGMLHISGNQITAKPSLGIVTVAGVVGGAVQVLVSCPVDLVKIKLQMQGTSGAGNYTGAQRNGPINTSLGSRKYFKGPIDCLIVLYKTQGLRGWYKGFTTMLYRDVPSYGLYMFCYEWIVRNGEKYATNDTRQNLLLLFAGGTTGVITWLSILPIDVVKSRIQADCPFNPKYQGMVHCFKVCYETEGLNVFFRGIWPVAIRALIVNAITLFVYEHTLRQLS